MTKDQYWAAEEDEEKLGTAIFEQLTSWGSYLESSGLLPLVKASYRAYYGMDQNSNSFAGSHQINQAGDAGELTTARVNDFANLVNNLTSLVTQQKIALKSRATNTDSDTQAATRLADGIVDYYVRDFRLERLYRRAVKRSLIMLEGWLITEWDEEAGPDYAPAGDVILKSGDVSFVQGSLLDVARDPERDDLPWIIYRKKVSRWDLIAKHPELKDKILSIAAVENPLVPWKKSEDTIYRYTLLHAPCASLPQGRTTHLLSKEVILSDERKLKTRKIPAFCVNSGDILETAIGWSSLLDVLAIEEAADALNAIILSNQMAGGVSNVWTKSGDNIEATQLGGGLRHFQSMEPPQAINTTKTPAEVFTALDRFDKKKETLSGVNSVVRGNPDASLESGAALALIATQAVQFISELSASHTFLVEDSCTSIIEHLQVNAAVQRVVPIVGRSNKTFAKTFSGQDLKGVEKVVMEITNSAAKTAAGRMNLAEIFLKAGFVKNPEQYLAVAETGQLTPLIENETKRLLNIRMENDALLDGEVPKALITDDHPMHAQEHLALLDDPDARKDDALVERVLEHVNNQHMKLWAEAPPQLLMALKIQPYPMQPPPPDAAPSAAPAMDATNPMVEQAQDVKLPSMPKNPLTGEPYDPNAGPEA